jgi:acetyl-CoA acyltransferase
MQSASAVHRVAIVSGLRTPFQKQATGFAAQSARELGVAVVGELLARSGLPSSALDQVVFGQVVPSLSGPNVAREVVLAAGLPRRVEAYSVSRACATSYQALVSAVESILAGSVECAVAGGTDSASDVPVTVSRALAAALLQASRARSLKERLGAFAHLRPADLLPVPPAIAELSTGLSMGESAEKMAKENGIGRAEQDELAHQSHVKASRAWAEGRFAGQVMTVFARPDFAVVERDNLVREDSRLDAYARLAPAFDRKHGTVTAGNSSALTDGAAALLVTSVAAAERHGLSPLGYVRSWAFAALDPAEQLLMGPAYAIPLALERAGLRLEDMTLIDLHEAFSAQVLSNLRALASPSFARDKLGRSAPVGEVDRERLNVSGGSLALGHPFAATGARQVLQTLHELQRRGGGFGLCSACAAGGLGAALVLEVTP